MNYRECAALLSEKDKILLVSHKNPDGDTVGSAAALCSALRRLGKTAYLYPNGQIIKKLRPYAEKFFAPADFTPAYYVAVDVATEKLFAQGFEGKIDLCIDHHPTNSRYAPQALIRDEKSSCGEIILELIKAMGKGVSKEEATLLYIALTTDTGCFQYANVSARSLAAASELVRLGADNREVSLVFFRKLSPARMKLEGMIYSSMSFHRDGKVTVATVTRAMLSEAGATEDDCDDLAGLAGRARGQRCERHHKGDGGGGQQGFRPLQSRSQQQRYLRRIRRRGPRHGRRLHHRLPAGEGEGNAAGGDRRGLEMNGILLIDKPSGWTSSDVVAKLRGILQERRVGHSGTLDPMATGLLVVFVGRATRAVAFAESHSKRYRACLRLGISTDTQDTSGRVLAERPPASQAALEAVLPRFLGEQSQIPPMYSAIKIQGRKLCDIARRAARWNGRPEK